MSPRPVRSRLDSGSSHVPTPSAPPPARPRRPLRRSGAAGRRGCRSAGRLLRSAGAGPGRHVRRARRGRRLSRAHAVVGGAAQMDRCVALMTPMLRGHAVRSTAAARGGEGLEYVWVNADMHDDAEDIERRNAAGATVGGHCQFDDGGEAVHVHAYQLDLEAGAASGYPAYRYVAGLGDTDSARTASAAD
ncbi:hypothetical protein Ddc_19401 [Ditylenchus destructor]|nr:hypothetical protein Ddc_19401 [Ditylenchus destructor]